jgi:hypothetical protein
MATGLHENATNFRKMTSILWYFTGPAAPATEKVPMKENRGENLLGCMAFLSCANINSSV